jgi:hypothetical protein
MCEGQILLAAKSLLFNGTKSAHSSPVRRSPLGKVIKRLDSDLSDEVKVAVVDCHKTAGDVNLNMTPSLLLVRLLFFN